MQDIRGRKRIKRAIVRTGESVKSYVTQKSSVVLFAVITLTGLITGTLLALYSQKGVSDMIFGISKNLLDSRLEGSFFESFISLFSSTFIINFVVFLMGFWVISVICIYIIPFINGVGLGVIYTSLLMGVESGQFLEIAMGVLLQVIFSMVIGLYTCEASLKMSLVFYSQITKTPIRDSERYLYEYTKQYFIYFVYILIFSFFNSIILSIF